MDSQETKTQPTTSREPSQQRHNSPHAPAHHPKTIQKSSSPMSLTTALVATIVVILFIMLVLSMNNKLFQSNTTTPNDEKNLSTIEARAAQLRRETNVKRVAKGEAPLAEGAVAAKTMASRLSADANSLAAMAIQWQKELEIRDNALIDLQNQITSRDQNTQQLYAKNAKLKNELAELSTARSTIITLRNDLQIAQNQLLNYQKQLAEAQGRPSASEMAALRAKLNKSQEANLKLSQQIDALLAQSGNSVSQAKYDALAAELERIRPEYNRQRYIIQQLQAELDRTKLFIEKEKDLPAIASKLYARLKTLDNLSGQALTDAYKKIETELGARVVHVQSFATGSSEVTMDREKMIKAATTLKSKPNSFFLVVGYASTTGNQQKNYELSRKRATTTASVINTLKRPEQSVKAVYLGQTSRFDKLDPLKNQICEVWEIDR